jgi:hypothetical protein
MIKFLCQMKLIFSYTYAVSHSKTFIVAHFLIIVKSVVYDIFKFLIMALKLTCL